MQGAGWTVQNGRVGVIKTLTIKVVKQTLITRRKLLSKCN